MKNVRLVFALFVGCIANAAEPVTVTVTGTVFPAAAITGAANTSVTAPVIFGGLGDVPSPDWSGKVVLLDRGTLTFAAKVKAVQDVGGVAAIIADNVAGPLSTFTLAPSTSTIPAVSVTQATGAAIKLKAGETTRVGSPQAPAVIVLPDPAGHAGEFLKSDGAKLVYAKPPTVDPSAAIQGDVEAGKPVSFSVSASGTPPFTFQWMKDGVNIPNATAASFSIVSAQPADAGHYICQVTNQKGTSASGEYILSVKPAP